MNPNLSRLQAYPFERLRQLFAKVNPNPAYRAISLGIGEPRHATPQLVKDAYCAAIQGTGLSGYPATTGELALRQSIAQWLQRRYALALDVATQILPVNGSREALFAFAQTVVNPALQKSAGGLPQPVLPNLRRRGLLAGATAVLRPQRPGAQLCAWTGTACPTRVGAHPAAVCLLARQPHRRRDAAVRMEKAVCAERPLWLCDRLGRVLQRNLFPRRAAAGRPGGRRQLGRRLQKPADPSPACPSAATCPACAAALWPAMRAHQAIFALPHLPRQRHEPGGAGRQHGRLGRRGPCGGQPRAVPRQVRPGHAPAGRGAGRGLARRRLLPVGQGALPRWAATPTSPATCWLNTM
jgi:hypothetical protein